MLFSDVLRVNNHKNRKKLGVYSVLQSQNAAYNKINVFSFKKFVLNSRDVEVILKGNLFLFHFKISFTLLGKSY